MPCGLGSSCFTQQQAAEIEWHLCKNKTGMYNCVMLDGEAGSRNECDACLIARGFQGGGLRGPKIVTAAGILVLHGDVLSDHDQSSTRRPLKCNRMSGNDAGSNNALAGPLCAVKVSRIERTRDCSSSM